GKVRLGASVLLQSDHVGAPAGSAVDVVIRQEAIRLQRASDATGGLPGVVIPRSFGGARVQYVVKLEGGGEVVTEAASSGSDAALEIGAQVALDIASAAVFATATGEVSA